MLAKPMALILVFLSFLGGFLLMGGQLSALWHPAELVVIIGMAIGAYMAATPISVWKGTLSYFWAFIIGRRIQKQHYSELLELMGELTRKSRAQGLMSLEVHLDNPSDSQIFTMQTRESIAQCGR